MSLLLTLFTILGLAIFEIVSSLDNAIINAEVLATMGQKARRFFLRWGIFFAVFVVRGTLPWLIVYLSLPSLGPLGALTATFSNDPHIVELIESAAPILLMGGGVFLIFLFLHWLFLEEKKFGLWHEKFLFEQGVWFFAIASVVLAIIVWRALQVNDAIAFSAVVGSTAFFITHGFKQNAEVQERRLMSGHMSDVSKVLFLEIIDMTFSIDGVLGAFAFTLSVPLILIGNGIGAYVLRTVTVMNIDRIRRYVFLKNGAMYAVGVLGSVMILDGFGVHIPDWFAPLSTLSIVLISFFHSHKELQKNNEI